MNGIPADVISDRLITENDFILSQNPLNTTAWEYRALIFFNAGDYPDAINATQKALSLQPDSEFAWHILGTSWGNLGYYDRANEAFDKSLALGQADAGQWNKKGVALSKLNRYTDAIASFHKAVSLDPRYATAWNNLGVTQFNHGEYDAALASFDRAHQIDPDELLFLTNKAQTYRFKGDINAAEDTIKIITAKDPLCIPGMFISGDVAFLKENYDYAYTQYTNGLRTLQKGTAWYFTGDTKTRITKDMDPVTSYYESLAENINFTESWDKTTIIDYKLHRYSDTLVSYDQLLVIEPDYDIAKKNQAISALHSGRYETARTLLSQVIKDNQTDPSLIAGLALATAHQGDYLGSLEIMKHAVLADPDSGYIWGIKGDIYALYAQYDDAIESYEKSLALENNNDIRFSLSEVLFQKGDYAGSVIHHIRGCIGI